MSEPIKIPNVVGRLDDVIDALAAGKWIEARDLLRAEDKRRTEEVVKESQALGKSMNKRDQVREFLKRIENLEGLDEIQAACRLHSIDVTVGKPTLTGSLMGYTLRHRVEAKSQVGMIMIPEISAEGEIFSRGELIADEARLAELDPDFWLTFEPDGYWHGHLKTGFQVVRIESGGSKLERKID
jgi:hypothetical protein